MNLYPISSLFFYRTIFMGWLLFGEGLFLFKLKKRTHFVIRTLVSYLLCIGFAFAFPIPTGNSFYTMMMFFVMFFFTYLMAYFRYDCNWRNLLFSLICGYTAEHIAYEMYFSIANFSGVLGYGSYGLYSNDKIALFTGAMDELIYFISYFVVYYLVFLLFANRIKNPEGINLVSNLSTLAIGAFFLFIDIVINSAVSFYGTIHYDSMFMGFIALVNVLCCIVALLFIFEMSYKADLRRNLEIIEELRNEERNQYQISKETIDMINIKCHDMKHQIRAIASQEQVKPETIENISKLISIYDSAIKTSNPVLNIILTEKSLFCNKREIKFSCIADGTTLDFMSEEDIYSVFGNIIDNAIEAVKDLPKDQRIITLKIVSHGNMVSVSEKNSYAGKITYLNGMPVTRKSNKKYHGYGLRSIKMIVEKYGGTFSLEDKDNIFCLSVLFVLKAKK